MLFNRRTGKRLAAGAVALAAAVSLAACTGPDSATNDSSGTEGSGEVNRSIVFDYPYTMLPVYPIVLSAAQEEADAQGYELLTTEDEASLDKQVANLGTMISRGVGAIVSFPIETSALAPTLQQAQAAGTKWITYGGNMEGEDGSLDLANTESGELTAKALGEWLDAQGITSGTVLVLGNDTVELGRQRTDGMIEGLKKYAPGLTVVQELALGSDEGSSVTQAKLVADPSIDYVLAVNDDTAIGAANAFQEAGKDVATSFIAGNDGAPNVLKDIRDGNGYVKATIALNLSEVGRALVQTSIAAIEGTGSTTWSAVPVMATKDAPELDELIAQFD
ncbi:MAG: sugar ABC transporter substrate-binding protein [Candidatus Leucobacter sulfamidivorax]|nr:sugar ABC transporter substrate-binding protein [Candidatus Leucobacter sulfamidivorax]